MFPNQICVVKKKLVVYTMTLTTTLALQMIGFGREKALALSL